jgi:molecular chaperone DnaK (HSP70)
MYTATSSLCVGIDLGSSKLVAAYESGSIILNELGGRSTASLVSFNGKQRYIGEAAVPQQTSNAKNTFTDISRLVGRSYSDFKADSASGFYHFQSDDGGSDNLVLNCDYNDASLSTNGTKLLAMILGKIKKTATESAKFCIAVPGDFSAAQRKAVEDAAAIAEVDLARCV